MTGVPPSGSGSRASHEAAEASSPEASIPNAARHPGKTPAQRRVLDEIGCGNHSPIMAKSTRDKLLREGLIVELSPDVRPFIGAITFQIRRFEMPIPIHMQWCAAMSEQSEEDGA